MNCPQCGTQLQDRAIYCPACGIQARCKQCREELVRDARVCMLCGAPASPADANLTSQLPIVNRIRFVETDKRRSLDAELTDDAMAPWFAQAERRLNIGVWLTAPNENNDLLRRGADKLGIRSATIHRNVKGCWNLGSCGMGCPTNAKQSMLVTTLPAALDRRARLLDALKAR